MSNSTAAKALRNLFVRVSTQKNEVQAVENDLRELKVVWNGNKDVKTLFTSPKLISRQEKRVNSSNLYKCESNCY